MGVHESQQRGQNELNPESSHPTQVQNRARMTLSPISAQVTIKNIHLRFEEDGICSHAPAPFAAGVCIEEFTAYTCDKDEKPFFSKKPEGWLKRTELNGLSIYWDSGTRVHDEQSMEAVADGRERWVACYTVATNASLCASCSMRARARSPACCSVCALPQPPAAASSVRINRKLAIELFQSSYQDRQR